eukprot:13324931-Heterocapsa_arctica.AAC.1
MAISPYQAVDSGVRVIDPDMVRQGVMMLMMDSSAFLHVCPLSFMPQISLRRLATPPKALAASGEALQFFGMRKVQLETFMGIRLAVDFAVMSVSRPIISAGALTRRGLPSRS